MDLTVDDQDSHLLAAIQASLLDQQTVTLVTPVHTDCSVCPYLVFPYLEVNMCLAREDTILNVGLKLLCC